MKILLLEAELFQVDERIIGHTDRRVDGQTDVHTHTHTHTTKLLGVVRNFFQRPKMWSSLHRFLILHIPMAAMSKAWYCNLSHAVICGFECLREHGSLSLVSDICCVVKGSASG